MKKRSTLTVSSTFSTARSGWPAATRPSSGISHRSSPRRERSRCPATSERRECPSPRSRCPRRATLRARAAVAVAHRPHRARLEILARQIALLLERLEVIVDAVGGADAEVLADLAQRRRIAALVDGGGDELEDVSLALSQMVGHERGSTMQLNKQTVLNISPPCQINCKWSGFRRRGGARGGRRPVGSSTDEFRAVDRGLGRSARVGAAGRARGRRAGGGRASGSSRSARGPTPRGVPAAYRRSRA